MPPGRARAPAGAPTGWEADVVCRDGSTVRIRSAIPGDWVPLAAFLGGLSDPGGGLPALSSGSARDAAAPVEPAAAESDRFSLVATAGAAGPIVDHARAQRTALGRADVALAVADGWQGRGLGTLLLGHLAEVAAVGGIAVRAATTGTDDRAMIEVFSGNGRAVSPRRAPGVVWLEFAARLSADALTRYETREDAVARSALRRILASAPAAVIGASRRPGTMGGEIRWNLERQGFSGTVIPVTSAAHSVQRLPAYSTLTAVPPAVDLAVIAVPASRVGEGARACAAARVSSLLVVSAGFAATRPSGRERQQELLPLCCDSGMRLVGPHCMGMVNTDPEVTRCAPVAPQAAAPGRVGVLSQSGALELAIMEATGRLGLGLSGFVSVGNKADISGNDCIASANDDPRPDLIVLNLELFGNPVRLARRRRPMGRRTPIVAVTGGRSSAGVGAAVSHTRARVAASPAPADGHVRQAGVVRTEPLSELVDTVAVPATQPLPTGPRVGIPATAGGLAIHCADACEDDGHPSPTLAGEVQARLRAFLSPEAAVADPVDRLAGAGPDDYTRAIAELGTAHGIDSLIVIFIPPLRTERDAVVWAVRAGARTLSGKRPVLTGLPVGAGRPDSEGGRPVATFPYSEEAARALGRAVGYASGRSTPPGTVPSLGRFELAAARGVIADVMAQGPRWLSPMEALARCLAHVLGGRVARPRAWGSRRGLATASRCWWG